MIYSEKENDWQNRLKFLLFFVDLWKAESLPIYLSSFLA